MKRVIVADCEASFQHWATIDESVGRPKACRPDIPSIIAYTCFGHMQTVWGYCMENAGEIDRERHAGTDRFSMLHGIARG